MKKIIVAAMIMCAVLSACSNKADEEAARQQALEEATRQQLTEAINDRDQLLTLVNEIAQDMEQIKALENVLTSPNGAGETVDRRQAILDDIAALQQTLQQRREQLAALQKKLDASNITNKNLRQTIANLNAQIDAQAQEIASLKNNLIEANEMIGKLDARIDTLSQTVTAVTAEKDQAEQQSAALTQELNTCYYAIGTKSELKEHGIIESGFLRRTKILEGEFDKTFFIKADKTALTRIALHSKKAEVMSNQPAASYQIVEEGGQKVLVITDPKAFWNLTNYLVVKVD